MKETRTSLGKKQDASAVNIQGKKAAGVAATSERIVGHPEAIRKTLEEEQKKDMPDNEVRNTKERNEKSRG